MKNLRRFGKFLKNEYSALGDPTAIREPQKFVEDIARRCDRKIIEVDFNRCDYYTEKGDLYNANRYRHSTERWYTARFMLRSKCPSKP